MTYVASTTRRERRTKREIAVLKSDLYDLIAEMQAMIIRQIFYQMVSRGLIDKTETEYAHTCLRLLGDMRKAYELPFHWIADNIRWMRKPRTHHSLEAMPEGQEKLFRRALWRHQSVRCEIWIEKDALSAVVVDVTDKWDVPLMVCKGYPSLSFLYSASESIKRADKPTYIYYFGNPDPSGVDKPPHVEKHARRTADAGCWRLVL